MIPEASRTPTLHIAIVVYESDLSRLRATLESLNASAVMATESGTLAAIALTLVDNGSSASYRTQLHTLWSTWRESAMPELKVALISAPNNEGFGAGQNSALLSASEDHLLILNPDVVLDESALARSASALAENSSLVALNPRSTRSDGQREYLSKSYPSLGVLLFRALGLKRASACRRYEYRDEDGSTAFPVMLLSGAFLYCRGEAFRAIRGFDERYFLYFEDFDLSMRLAGLGPLCFDPAVEITHYGGEASRKGVRHVLFFLRSAFRFFSTHGWRLF
ncbi:MAG: glycosyltransferase [Pseudomonadota bacterium]